MTRALPLYLMAPGTSPEGTALDMEAPSNNEIAQRMKDAMESMKDTKGNVIAIAYLVPSHPPTCLEPGFVQFVSFPSPFILLIFVTSLILLDYLLRWGQPGRLVLCDHPVPPLKSATARAEGEKQREGERG